MSAVMGNVKIAKINDRKNTTCTVHGGVKLL